MEEEGAILPEVVLLRPMTLVKEVGVEEDRIGPNNLVGAAEDKIQGVVLLDPNLLGLEEAEG